MNLDDQLKVIGLLYLLYKAQAKELQKVGYSKEHTFWLSFTCLPFLPWDKESQDEVSLSQVLRLYVGIYQYNTNNSLKVEDVPRFFELLIDRYRMAKNIVDIEDQSRLTMELGRFALPGDIDPLKQAEAATIVLHTIAEWKKQRGREHLPCRLVDDI